MRSTTNNAITTNNVVDLQAVLEAEKNIEFGTSTAEVQLHTLLNKPAHWTTPKNHNITRRNSTLTILESVIKNQKVIEQCLQVLRKDEELTVREDMVTYLQHFVNATEFLQRQKYSTLNYVLIFLADIERTLNLIKSSKSESTHGEN